MKNKKRKDFIKPMKILSLVSLLFLLGCLIIGFVSGDFVNTGFYLLLLGFGVFIALQVWQYKMMTKCRCKKCGYVEVFESKRFVVSSVKKRCPKCNTKLKEDEIIE